MTQVIITPPPAPPPVDPGSDAPPTFTITYYRQLAHHLSSAIDEMSAIIPRLQETVPRTSTSPKPASGHHNISLAFLCTSVDSVEQLPELQVVKKLDVGRGRDTLQLIDAFRSIGNKWVAFFKEVQQVLDARQSALAVEALDIYAVAQVLDRDKSNPALTACVENMKRDLGRSGHRKKKPAPAPAAETPEGNGKDTEPRGHAARV